MELNAEQIKKALEWCTSGGNCSECPMDSLYPYCSREGCMAKQMYSALSLINELTEKEKKSDRVFSDLYKEAERYLAQRECLRNQVKKLTEENERLRAEEHWISVKDKLPDNYRAVLVVCESTSISGGRLRAVGSYGGGFWSMADADGTMRLTKYMQYVVTHWMELPQMPNRKIDQIAKEMLEEE